MHPHRNALAAPLLLPCILMAAPALEWRADLADTGAATLYARHGDEIGLSCRLTLRGEPYAPASALCHYQTNGMGAAWWEAPVTLASNVATVAWSPALDPGADLVLLMLEFDGAHRAALHLHLRPGPSGGAAPLPPPAAVLDFATQPYTNAPWALPSDIPPAPDLSPYATTSQVAEAIAAAAGGEWAADSHRWIAWEPVESPAMTAVEDWLDARRSVTTAAGTLSCRLHAWRETRGEEVETAEMQGSWEIVSGSRYASLSNGCLVATGATGPVAVRFTADDGAETAAHVPMSYTLPGQTVTQPCDENIDTSSWRLDTFMNLFGDFSSVVAYPGPSHDYRHGRGGETNTWCRGIPDAIQLYTWEETANPATVNPDFFYPPLADLMRCQSVGRTDFQTSPATRPAMFISEHMAICSAHYTPTSAVFCLDRETPVFRTYTFRVAATGVNDLRLLWSDDAFPTNLLPRLLRAGELSRLSPSLYAAGLGVYQSQHGTVHPCLVWPFGQHGNDTFSTIHPDGVLGNGRNVSAAALAPLRHVVHGGDSGHAVCIVAPGYRWLIPVGLYYSGGGGGAALLSASVQDWLEREMGKYGEAPLYLTAEDLQ